MGIPFPRYYTKEPPEDAPAVKRGIIDMIFKDFFNGDFSISRFFDFRLHFVILLDFKI